MLLKTMWEGEILLSIDINTELVLSVYGMLGIYCWALELYLRSSNDEQTV